MARQILLLLLANAAFNVNGECKVRQSREEPKVTVADSENLLVNWEKSFESCNSSKVQRSLVTIPSFFPFEVKFDDKEAKVGVNPCWQQTDILMRLTYNGKEILSHRTSYNYHNAFTKIKDLYSGMLQKQVVDKTCVKKDRELSVPDIPEELSKCVLNSTVMQGTESTNISFTIQDPRSIMPRQIVKSEIKRNENCSSVATEVEKERRDKGESGSQAGTGIIISCSIIGTLLGVILVAAAIWMCFKRFKNERMLKQDINVNYDRAGVDYEYDTTGQDYDYDTMGDEVSTRRRREIKMEVVDRNSIYGKTEEGWEGAVAVDKNPVYGN